LRSILQVRRDRLREFVAGPGSATLGAVSGSPRNPASSASDEGHLPKISPAHPRGCRRTAPR
jgi:hypothetical protein